MIRKLQIKLLAASLASLTLVLAVIFGAACLRSYYTVVSTADEILDLLAKNGGTFFPSKDEYPDRNTEWTFYDSAEIPYESRYFSVLLDENGNVLSADVGQIAAVDEDTACSYALDIIEDGRERGFYNDYRYLAFNEEAGTRIIFLDCGKFLYSYNTSITTTIIVAFVGILAVFLLMLLLSKRIVKPIIDSYNKQRQFVTDAGHEIKTPLTIINADAELLAMELGDDNEWVNDIKAQTARLTELTNNLIMLSRLQETGDQPQMVEFPVSGVAEEAAQSFVGLAKTRGKKIELNIEPLLTLKGNEKTIRQLISLLMDNAVKYAPEGTGIVFSVAKTGKTISISTLNEAPNVSKEDIPHMFDRFYRAEKSHNSKTGGYGIGLSIALAIVNSHHGKITAQLKDGGKLLINAEFPA